MVFARNLSDCPTGCLEEFTCDIVDDVVGSMAGVCDFEGIPLSSVDFGCDCAGCSCNNGTDRALRCILTDDSSLPCQNHLPQIDPYGIRADKVGRVYVTQYTEFTNPLVLDAATLKLRGQVKSKNALCLD